MKLKASYLIAAACMLAIVLWFAFGGRKNNPTTPEPPADTPGHARNTQETALPKVVVKTIQAQQHTRSLILHGVSEPDKEVRVKAETAGLVVETPVKEGQFVEKGTLLCRQDVDARAAALAQSKALLRTRELEYEAAKTLVKKGYRSETQSAAAKAALDGAKAAVKQAEIELGNIEMRAPFAGVFETRLAETGDYLAPGQPCGLLVDLNPLVIVVDVTEDQISLLHIGQTAKLKLATSENRTGKIRLIETKADPATRTFRIEIATPNASRTLKAGVTSNVRITTGKTRAHFIPAAVLTLNDKGEMGVRILDATDRVEFRKVQTIDEDEAGIWVTGLAPTTRLIVQGQDYVKQGTHVQALTSETAPSNEPPKALTNGNR